MAIIDNYRNILTVIKTIELSNDDTASAVTKLNSFVTAVLKDLDGYISCNIHIGIDENIVILYEQWKSSQDYKNARTQTEVIDFFNGFKIKEVKSKVVSTL